MRYIKLSYASFWAHDKIASRLVSYIVHRVQKTTLVGRYRFDVR